MCGGFQRSFRHLWIYAGAIALLAWAAVSPAAEPTGPGLPVQGHFEPPQTTPVGTAPDVVPTRDVTRPSSEDALPFAITDEYAPSQLDHPHYVVPTSEHSRSTRVHRSDILGRLWVRAEYLAWAPKGVDLPALVIGGPAADPADATVLFGDSRISPELSSGGRLTGGFWCTPQQLGGIEASYFEIDGNDKGFLAEGEGDAILARPFINVQTGLPNAALAAFPGVLDGVIDVRADMELTGAECLWRRMVACHPNSRLDIVAGYRYGRLLDRVKTEEFLVSLDPASGWNTRERRDLFKTVNDFHGGQFGLITRWRHSCWSVDVSGKVALGNTTIITTIDGFTQTEEESEEDGQVVLVTTARPGGLLALDTNIGRYSRSEFAVMSELEVTLRGELATDLWIRFGYNLLAWSRVDRAADQIDLGMNPSQIPPGTLDGEARPAFTPRTTSFWAQGLNVGLEHQF
jgi:hypothetical protein